MSDKKPDEATRNLAAEVGVNIEPDPVPNDTERGAHDILIERIRARKEFGLRKYGTLLQPSNGRSNLEDALDEGTDLLVYLVNELEREKRRVDITAFDFQEAIRKEFARHGTGKNHIRFITRNGQELEFDAVSSGKHDITVTFKEKSAKPSQMD